MLSPSTAPAAATRPSGTMTARSPLEAATAAAATSTVSLGTGGEEPVDRGDSEHHEQKPRRRRDREDEVVDEVHASTLRSAPRAPHLPQVSTG